MLAATVLTLALLGNAHTCSKGTSCEAGIVCRISKPALLVCKYQGPPLYPCICLPWQAITDTHYASSLPGLEPALKLAATVAQRKELNQETAKVIQTAFHRVNYPNITGEKAMMLLGRVKYGLYK
ncbi:hypothetical protein P7K49_036408 [Saguinus oedipus]|uniref:Uncharacterized protein n=1 Tax=Saguinus oedipus TaxID=9490 RepID=A0ABQ9TK56_SAGOE|nr:hypothetical protein P7K49_036408 [Saguinus oedipus]